MKLSKETIEKLRDIIKCRSCDWEGFGHAGVLDGARCPRCRGKAYHSLPKRPKFLKD